jgi:hypothetical protein
MPLIPKARYDSGKKNLKDRGGNPNRKGLLKSLQENS